MESRRDQVHAYFYLVGRLNAAVMQGRPDPYEPPNRRPVLGLVLGILLALVIAGIFGIYGVFRPGGDSSWRQPAAIILVKETGARYLLLDGQLRPVLNYTSARLILGGGTIVQVSRHSLRGVPVGAPIGIPGAPDAVPAADRMLAGPWTVCAQPPAPSGQAATTILLGEVAGLTAVADGDGFLVSAPGGETFLVWQERRYRLPEASAVALGYAGLAPVRVTPAWLNPVPAGRDLAFPSVPGRGQRGPTIGGRASVVGQVFEVRNPATRSAELYLAATGGLVRLSRTTAALLLADPAVRAAYPAGAVAPIPVRPDEVAGVPVSASTDLVAGYPPEPPRPVTATGVQPCVRYRSTGASVTINLARVGAQTLQAAVPIPRASAAGGTADRVLVPPGGGALARNPYAPGAGGGALFVVTEYGVKFPLPPAGAQALGYGGLAPVDVPAELLELLPTGAVLDPAAALVSQTWGG